MKKSLLSCALAVSVFSSAYAADTYLETSQEMSPVTFGAQKNSVGVGLAYFQSVYDGVDDETKVFPRINYSYERFFIKGFTMGYTLYGSQDLAFAAVLQPQFGGYDADDSHQLNGMTDKSFLVNAGGEVMYRLKPIVAQLSVLHDMTGRTMGNQARLKLSTGIPLVDKRFIVAPSVAAVWQDSKITDYYYGVSSSEATASRAEYSPGSSWYMNYSLAFMYNISQHWLAAIAYNVTQYDDEVTDSPIVGRDFVSTGTISASYIF
jgi:MipA family protein